MVGTVIFKDFESGSYEDMRLTIYEGSSYEDIQRGGDFVSCVVNPEALRIRYDHRSSDSAPSLRMRQVLQIARKAREYLYEHTYVTMAEFCIRGDDVDIRTSSVKSGVYEPVDIRAAFYKGVTDVYRLVSHVGTGSVLYVSVLCEALNFCVGRLFCIEEPLFGFSAGAIYANAALFTHSGEAMAAFGLDKSMKAVITTKRKKRHMLRFRPESIDDTEPQGTMSYGRHRSLILSYRSFKCEALKLVCSSLPANSSPKRMTRFILSLADDDKLRSLCDRFCRELKEFAEGLEHYFVARSHIEYTALKDILYLAMDADLHTDVAQKARAASINMKLQSKLPNPDYYDSRGRAYWTKG